MEPWNLKDTYALVRTVYGREQEMLAKASTQSLVDRLNFARYHYGEIRRLQRAFERKHLAQGLLVDLFAQDGARKRAALESLMVKAGAHATAAIQSVHTIPDILAHAVYYSTRQQIKRSSPQGRSVSIGTVLQVLESCPDLAELADVLRRATVGESWNHLSAIANSSKHRSVVRAVLSEDLTGNRQNFRELHISAFERDGRPYPAVALQALLELEHDRLSTLIVEAGHALGTYLRAIAD